MDVFDKTEVFEEKCRPLLEELQRQCTVARIPFFFTFCVKSDEESSEYVSDGVMTGSTHIHLKDDRIKKHLMINLGFDVTPKKNSLEIIMDSPDDI